MYIYIHIERERDMRLCVYIYRERERERLLKCTVRMASMCRMPRKPQRKPSRRFCTSIMIIVIRSSSSRISSRISSRSSSSISLLQLFVLVCLDICLLFSRSLVGIQENWDRKGGHDRILLHAVRPIIKLAKP